MKRKHILLKEYDFLHTKAGRKPETHIDPELFEELERFVLENEEYGEFLQLKQKKGFGKVLQARNYVGVVQAKNGTTIEILPKIAGLKEKETEKTRRIVVEMLKTLKNSPFKSLDRARLKSAKMPLFEIFIAMFLDELARMVRQGIRSDYLPQEENLKYLRGKLLMAQNLKRNLMHKERFFVIHDEYSPDRMENRLIKATLAHIYKKSRHPVNQRRIREFLFVFDEITPSTQPKEDFKKIKPDRQMQAYHQVLMWCRTFLFGESFTPYRGENVAFALLFDMNLLFESYVFHRLKKDGGFKNITAQHRGKYLVYEDGKRPKFALIPDIVIDPEGEDVVIADTKWKILSEEKSNQGVSQADLYQLYAYAAKYGAKRVFLIYPRDNIAYDEGKLYRYFRDETSHDQIDLKILFFDLVSPKENSKLIEWIKGDTRT